MISHKHRCIFVHVPKTGGTSIASVLEERLDFSSADNDTFPRHSHTCRDQHCLNVDVTDPDCFILKHQPGVNINKKYNNYKKFAFVRNPWDLMVSSYNWWTQRTTLPHRKEYGQYLLQKGFKYFIQSKANYINEMYHAGMGQKYWLTSDMTIGRYENIQNDFNKICNLLDIPCQQLPCKNKTQHDHYSKYYDSETIDIVTSAYIEDIRQFKYEYREQ